MDFLLKIQESNLAQWIRESDSVFAYSGILLMHTIGMGFVVGINACLDLRILGFAPRVKLSPMQKFFPVLWLGFYINAITGSILLAIDAAKLLVNPDFYIKMAFIALALINLRMLRNNLFGAGNVETSPLSNKVKLLALTSLVFWLGAITSGRLLAYVGSVGKSR